MEVHCTNEEAGGKKQVLAEFRLEEVFLPFRNDRKTKKKVILGFFFYESVEK